MTGRTTETAPRTRGSSASHDERQTVSRRGRRLLAAIIVILMLALIGISAVLLNTIIPRGGIASDDESGGLEWVRSIYGWGSTPDTQLTDPRELTIGPDGTIWATDSKFPKQVLAFSPEGKLVTTVGESFADAVMAFASVAVGPDGSVYTGESDMDRVHRFDSDGTYVGTFAIPSPFDLDYRDGELVAGAKAGWAMLDPETGTPSIVVGTNGKGPEEFDVVHGITLAPDGRIYMVDTYNNRLAAFDKDGTRVWTVVTGASGNEVDVTGAGAVAASTLSTAPAQLQLPADICVDGNGRLVVIDAFDFSITVFDPEDGSVIAKYGEYGALDGQLAYPSSIAYDPDRDWFAVADTGNSRIQILRIPGSGSASVVPPLRRALAGPLRACGIPLALLVVAMIVLVVLRVRRRRRAASETPDWKPQAGGVEDVPVVDVGEVV